MQSHATSPDNPILQNLRRLADQIRVQLHLAEMDAKDTWAKLEPKLRELERKAEAARGKLTEDAKKASAELEEQMNKLLHGLGKD